MTRDELLVLNVVGFMAQQFVEDDVLPTEIAAVMVSGGKALTSVTERMVELADQGKSYVTLVVDDDATEPTVAKKH